MGGSGKVSQAEFSVQMRNPSSPLRTYLEGLGLDKVAVQRFFAMLLESSKDRDREVDINTFVQGCLQIRTPATALDMFSSTLQAQLFSKKLDVIQEQTARRS